MNQTISRKNFNYKKLGKIVQKARLSKGFTQEKLAFYSNISIRYLSDIENGKVNNPSLVKFWHISNALEMPISEFLKEL
ncbi:MAG TPA: helix-turn-helix transcriptional regulator [Candidatus Dojkabacteria bacterium]|jgi:transcriptional regulator with XRE-family HTH domain